MPTTQAPATILDGDVTEFAPLPGGWVVEELVEPVTTECGPERCGSGGVTVTGGRLRARAGYTIAFFDASGSGRWWNYGAPHGTHVEVRVKWVKDEMVGMGCAGWWVKEFGGHPRFLRAHEQMTPAGRVVRSEAA